VHGVPGKLRLIVARQRGNTNLLLVETDRTTLHEPSGREIVDRRLLLYLLIKETALITPFVFWKTNLEPQNHPPCETGGKEVTSCGGFHFPLWLPMLLG